MKIVHVIFSFNFGGAETLLVDILNQQYNSEEVSLIVVNNSFNKFLLENIDPNIKVILIRRNPGSFNPIPIILYNLWLFYLKPDIVHCHNVNLIGITFKNILKAKIVLTVHGLGRNSKYLQKYDKIYSISETVAKDISCNTGLSSNIVYNGIDFDEIKFKKDFHLGKFKIVQIGRLSHYTKGQHILIEAARLLMKNYNFFNFSIDIIGDGPSLKFLESMIMDYQLEKTIKILGEKERSFIYEHLSIYDLLVQPSFSEGFGLAIIEALAANLPVLVSDIPGPQEIIQNGKFGNFFSSGDPHDCARQILNIMYNYSEIFTVSKIARKYAYSKFSIKSVARKYLEEYYSLV